jgi:hypothetical protein
MSEALHSGAQHFTHAAQRGRTTASLHDLETDSYQVVHVDRGDNTNFYAIISLRRISVRGEAIKVCKVQVFFPFIAFQVSLPSFRSF